VKPVSYKAYPMTAFRIPESGVRIALFVYTQSVPIAPYRLVRLWLCVWQRVRRSARSPSCSRCYSGACRLSAQSLLAASSLAVGSQPWKSNSAPLGGHRCVPTRFVRSPPTPSAPYDFSIAPLIQFRMPGVSGCGDDGESQPRTGPAYASGWSGYFPLHRGRQLLRDSVGFEKPH
jgi:hypothetical protein